MLNKLRYLPYAVTVGIALALAMTVALWPQAGPGVWLLLALAVVLALLGSWDLLQSQHSLRRNYPLSARMRWMLEYIRPELRQYFFESDTGGRPFSREQRALVYQRAKNVNDNHPFGTEHSVNGAGYEWISHSIAPHAQAQPGFRVTVGGAQCRQPYAASVLNISAMSFGALSANAIRALNRGAKIGGFYHDTGEGGLSVHHAAEGGDLVWELGSGYFGCRSRDGHFDPERFADTARSEQVKMVEIKLSQGAKPGHGGVLPGKKVSAEIAAARGVPAGQDCISPSAHSAFSTPVELLQFVARLRELCGGKPVGFKLCIGHRSEFLGIIKAMLETQILPDFIVIDGGEGGTGAAPLELTNHVGMPLREGLIFAQNALVGAGLRGQLKLAASGKISSGFRLAANLALGADWCNAARGFMFSLGCVQSLHCHTNHCPTGIATQDPLRGKALVVADKAPRVASFHHHSLAALAEIVASAGLDHPAELQPQHLHRRRANQVLSAADYYPWLQPGQLLDDCPADWQPLWQHASASHFAGA